MTSDEGLRARKKRQTRERIVEAAAALFAERGFEHVSVRSVAEAADVAEQTVWNHFPTKEALVLDRDESLQAQLVDAVRHRPAGTSPVGAVRDLAVDFAESVGSMAPEQLRGGLGSLSAGSPAVRRLSLAMTDRHADAVAGAIRATTPGVSPAVAKIQGLEIAWIFQLITDEVGRRARAGQRPATIARHARRVVDEVVAELDRSRPPG